MFDYIKIEGFRSFKSVELEMPRLAVLIGPNGGGKSNFVDLLMLMAKAGSRQLTNAVFERGGFPSIAFGFDALQEICIELRLKKVLHAWEFEQGAEARRQNFDVRYKVIARNLNSAARITEELVREESASDASRSLEVMTRGPQGVVLRAPSGQGVTTEGRVEGVPTELAISQFKDPVKYPAASAVSSEMEGWSFYRDIDVGPQSPVRQPALIRPGTKLLADGSNLSSMFYAIQQDWPDAWEEMLEIVRTAYPGFVRLTVPAGGGDGKVLLRWYELPYGKGGMSANLLSDGTLKLLCLIAILKAPEPPSLICVDEPELGLHPDWIKLVAELLQDAACRTQVIVATHSPHIVAKLDPDQVIVVDKVDGESKMKRLKKAELEKWLKDFNLSELWLAGHFGGRP